MQRCRVAPIALGQDKLYLSTEDCRKFRTWDPSLVGPFIRPRSVCTRSVLPLAQDGPDLLVLSSAG